MTYLLCLDSGLAERVVVTSKVAMLHMQDDLPVEQLRVVTLETKRATLAEVMA